MSKDDLKATFPENHLMSLYTLTKESHKDPARFRLKYDDAVRILGEHQLIPLNRAPAIELLSQVFCVGAGLAGMLMALKFLRDTKLDDFFIFEKLTDLGGTWHNNLYLGAALDIPAAFYLLSGELVSNWLRPQPLSHEYQEYLDMVANKYNLRKYIQFNTAVKSVKWDEKTARYTIEAYNVKTGQKYVHRAAIVLNCVGTLAQPNHFHVKGLDTFTGDYMHLAVWNHNVQMEGKRVVLIGNGCTANQAFSEVLKQKNPKTMTQIVRSLHYIMPEVPNLIQWIYNVIGRFYFGAWLMRMIIAMVCELRWPLFRGNGPLARLVRWYNTRTLVAYMKKTCPKQYQDALIPKFKVGCKRIIFDHDYLHMLHDPRVLVETLMIKEINGDTLTLEDGTKIGCDVLIACTGYDVQKSITMIDVQGHNGHLLKKTWDAEGISAYRTIMVKDIPNFFIIHGPNSVTGHSLVIMAIENALDYVFKVLKPVREGKARLVEVKPEAYDSWLTRVQHDLKECVFGTPFGGCVSWYATAKTNFTTLPWSQLTYWWLTHWVNYRDLVYVPAEKKTA